MKSTRICSEVENTEIKYVLCYIYANRLNYEIIPFRNRRTNVTILQNKLKTSVIN